MRDAARVRALEQIERMNELAIQGLDRLPAPATDNAKLFDPNDAVMLKSAMEAALAALLERRADLEVSSRNTTTPQHQPTNQPTNRPTNQQTN